MDPKELSVTVSLDWCENLFLQISQSKWNAVIDCGNELRKVLEQ